MAGETKLEISRSRDLEQLQKKAADARERAALAAWQAALSALTRTEWERLLASDDGHRREFFDRRAEVCLQAADALVARLKPKPPPGEGPGVRLASPSNILPEIPARATPGAGGGGGGTAQG